MIVVFYQLDAQIHTHSQQNIIYKVILFEAREGKHHAEKFTLQLANLTQLNPQ